MNEQPRISVTQEVTQELNIVYRLFFRNAYYSVECYKEGTDLSLPVNYAMAEDFTEDEGEAEYFIQRLIKGKVFPVHIKELVDDIFH